MSHIDDTRRDEECLSLEPTLCRIWVAPADLRHVTLTNIGAYTRERDEARFVLGTFDQAVYRQWKSALKTAGCTFITEAPLQKEPQPGRSGRTLHRPRRDHVG